jgi:hypothetical protein
MFVLFFLFVVSVSLERDPCRSFLTCSDCWGHHELHCQWCSHPAKCTKNTETCEGNIFSQCENGPRVVGFLHAATDKIEQPQRLAWRGIASRMMNAFRSDIKLRDITSRVYVTLAAPTFDIIRNESQHLFGHSKYALRTPQHNTSGEIHKQFPLPTMDILYSTVFRDIVPTHFLRHKTDKRDPFFLALAIDQPHLYEWPTISMIYYYCKRRPQDLVWYVHTKGERYIGKSISDTSNSWREYMQYFIFHRGPEWCVPFLVRGEKDICGVNWEKNHFPGNFWWSSCMYIANKKRLPFSHIRYGVDRYAAELWLAQNEIPPPRVFCMHRALLPNGERHSFPFPFYSNSYPSHNYVNATIGKYCHSTEQMEKYMM